jgi:hypothetical protein
VEPLPVVIYFGILEEVLAGLCPGRVASVFLGQRRLLAALYRWLIWDNPSMYRIRVQLRQDRKFRRGCFACGPAGPVPNTRHAP